MDTKALRQKILDLAIRGKLVPQDPNDEPASVLLERIRAEKQQMVKEGKLKAKDIKNDTVIFKGDDNLHYEKFPDGSVKCIEEEIPFELPQGWEWSRFSSAFIINPRNNLPDDTEVSFVPMSLIQEGYANNHTFEKKTWSTVKSGFTHFAENDIGVAKITPCFENKKSVVFGNLTNGFGAGTTELHIIRSINDSICPEYVLWFIKTDSFISNGVNAFSGAVGQKRIGKDFVEKYLIPIAPTSEQKRIVERISTAFKFIDDIDASKEAFKLDVEIIKSKILDLAIRGKLVPQDPNDEPASVLLERIRAEKEELIKQGKIKRDKKESVIFKGDDNSYYEKIGDEITCIDDELPFEIPDNWCWARLSSLTSQIFAGGDKPVNYSKEKTEFYPIPIYSNGVENDGLYGYTDIPRVSERSLTISARGTIGFACVRTEPFVPIIRLLTIIPIKGIDVEFLKLVFQFFIESGKGSSIPQLTVPEVKPKLIPVPSIEEQRKIAQAINNLFVLIESITASLS